MKHTKLMAIVTLLLLGAGAAAAQSLGDYARAVRKNKAETSSTARHYDNDNLPTSETLERGRAAAGGRCQRRAAKRLPSILCSGGTPNARRRRRSGTTKIAKQKAKIDSLNHELDLDQREFICAWPHSIAIRATAAPSPYRRGAVQDRHRRQAESA